MLVGWPPSVGPSVIVMDADLWSVSGQKSTHICFHQTISSSKPNASLLPFGKGFQMLTESRAVSLLQAEPVHSLGHIFTDSHIVYTHSFSHFQRENRSRQLLSVTVCVEFK